mmetsp:Transcript_96787/g.278459  ORF Transcript_96787/g.278459 Transcript_96787/m.278459 type:complete len:242 (-) Transcript_96787:106-831(-)
MRCIRASSGASLDPRCLQRAGAEGAATRDLVRCCHGHVRALLPRHGLRHVAAKLHSGRCREASDVRLPLPRQVPRRRTRAHQRGHARTGTARSRRRCGGVLGRRDGGVVHGRPGGQAQDFLVAIRVPPLAAPRGLVAGDHGWATPPLSPRGCLPLRVGLVHKLRGVLRPGFLPRRGGVLVEHGDGDRRLHIVGLVLRGGLIARHQLRRPRAAGGAVAGAGGGVVAVPGPPQPRLLSQPGLL